MGLHPLQPRLLPQEILDAGRPIRGDGLMDARVEDGGDGRGQADVQRPPIALAKGEIAPGKPRIPPRDGAPVREPGTQSVEPTLELHPANSKRRRACTRPSRSSAEPMSTSSPSAAKRSVNRSRSA